MKIIKFQGGLGNQIFQYVFYEYLKKKYKNVKVDLREYKNNKSFHYGFELEKILNIGELERADNLSLLRYSYNVFYNIPYLGRRIYSFINSKIYKFKKNRYTYTESNFSNENLYYKFKEDEVVYYDCFFQYESIFEKVSDEIKSKIRKEKLDVKNENIIKEMTKNNSVFLHVRRGNYLNHSAFQGICTEKYYSSAIKHIENNIKNPIFYVISNDITYCQTLFSEKNFFKYITFNEGEESYKNIFLMIYAKNAIIANSSFSWFGAKLGEKNIIIAPSKWQHGFKYIQKIKNAILINAKGEIES
jgi:hypothetical protein